MNCCWPGAGKSQLFGSLGALIGSLGFNKINPFRFETGKPSTANRLAEPGPEGYILEYLRYERQYRFLRGMM
jgi:hypothetical protein